MAFPSPTRTPSIRQANSQTHEANARIGHTRIFRPPESPASPSSGIRATTATDYFSSPYATRKRHTRDGSPDVRSPSIVTPARSTREPFTTPAWQQMPTPSDNLYGSVVSQGSAIVNERYSLAGGFDTPGLQAATEFEQPTSDFELDRRCRRRSGSWSNDGGLRIESAPYSGPLARERNGVGRYTGSSQAAPATSWAGYAFNLAGKLFGFSTCVFKGFYAGGGRGYAVKQSPDPASPQHPYSPSDDRATPVPGAWHSDDHYPRFSPNDHQYAAPLQRPATKRRQTDRESWVLVNTPGRDDSPRRKPSSAAAQSRNAHRASMSRTSSGRRTVLAPSLARRHSTFPNPSTSASPFTTFASPSPSMVSAAPLRRHSTARPASSHSRPTTPVSTLDAHHPPSPPPPQHHQQQQQQQLPLQLTPEVQRMVKRRTKQDRATDTAMNKMSRQVEDLIRQAQEAIGTKVSVEGEAEEDVGFDEAFVDVDDEW